MVCSWFNCEEEATVKSTVSYKTYFCNKHWEINILRFGCPDMFETIPEEDNEQEKSWIE